RLGTRRLVLGTACCQFFHGRTQIAGEPMQRRTIWIVDAYRATGDSASLWYAARQHDCQLEHASGAEALNLDKTTDGKNLAAGNYVMNMVSEGKTGSILVTIK